MTLSNKRILLIIGGGIAAYKSLDLIRRLRERGAAMAAAASQVRTGMSAVIGADVQVAIGGDHVGQHPIDHPGRPQNWYCDPSG